MAISTKIDAPFPTITLKTISNDTVVLGRPAPQRWQMLVMYRGLHCPICKKYLSQINDMKKDFTQMNVQIVAVSTDPEDKARKFASEADLDITVAYGLAIEQARSLGLYISTPLDSNETDKPFAEPGLFLIRQDGALHFAEVASAPFCRPDLNIIKMGIQHIQKNDYPPRGLG